MAILKNQILGDPSGKVGNVVNRNVGDKVIVAGACTDFHKSNSEASIANRNRFVPMSAFAKAVISFPELKAWWKKDKSPYGLSAFNEIQKYNAHFFNQFHPTLNNKLIDMGKIFCRVGSLTLNSSGIQLEFTLETPDTIPAQLINSYSVLCLTSLFNPFDSKEKSFILLTSRVELTGMQPSQNIPIQIPFNDDLCRIASLYKQGILYFVVAVKDKDNLVLAFSQSISAEFDLTDPQIPVKFPHPNGWTTIKLQLSDYWMKNLKPQPFMLTQNFYKNELGKQIFEFEVNNLNGIMSWIMNLGRGVVVLEPLELRLNIIEFANSIASNYKIDLFPPL